MTRDPTAFRAQFPVLQSRSYLNAGTEGPLPRRAAEAVHARIDHEVAAGRSGKPFFEATMELRNELRAGYARVLHCDPECVAITGSTTDGVNTILGGLDFSPSDEILTSDEEHPGLLAPLARLKRRFGVEVRVAPFAQLTDAVSERTKLIATSHVSWVGGQVIDHAGLAATGVPVLLDAAQGVGAVPTDMEALGCAFYAGSGQKWLCGPEGSGCLYVRPDMLDRVAMPWPGYGSLADAKDAFNSPPAEHAARFDHGFPPGLRSAWALASLSVLEEAGLGWVQKRAADLAQRLAGQLAERGLEVAPRGRSTLVSWRADDADAEVVRLAQDGFVVRSIPSHSYVRASVGGWSSEEELESLAQLASG